MNARFLKPGSNTRSTVCAIWENNLEAFEQQFSMIQSRCSIYSQITVQDFKKIPKSPHFLHLTSINWLVLKIRLF